MTESIQERRERAKFAKNLTPELKNTNPQEYAKTLAAAGVKPGGFRPAGGIPIRHYVEVEDQFDSPTLLAMAKYPKDTCSRWYKSQLTPEDVEFFRSVVPANPDAADKLPSISRLRNEAPSVFNDIEKAALAHKVITAPRRPVIQPQVAPVDDGRVNLGPKLAAVVGLSPDYRVTVEEYNDVLQFANQVEAAKAKA